MKQLWPTLSIRQPWAALIVHGLKTVEVRSWSTGRRGPILIHAGKLAEPDPEVWELLTTPALMETAAQMGGVIGTVELRDCITYRTLDDFLADAPRHRAGSRRFRPPAMFGFELAKARPVPFIPCVGNTGFFTVEAAIQPLRRTRAPRPRDPRFLVRLPEDG